MSIPKYKPSAEHRYFLYEPEGDGLLFFATEADRDCAARECISEYLSSSDGWGESVTDIFVGTVTGLTQATNLQKRPPDEELDEDGYDEDGTDWSHGFDEICSYKVLPLSGEGVSDE